MKYYLSTILLFVSFFAFNQSYSDLEILTKHINQESNVARKENHFKGLLKVYNRGITDQIINDCIYQQSCSNFGQHSFENYGIIKGLFVTYDRLTRCNRLSQTHVMPVRIDKEGKIDDPSDWYKK